MAGSRRSGAQTGPRAAGSKASGPKGKTEAQKAAEAVRAAQQARRQQALDTVLLVDGSKIKLADLTLDEMGDLEDHVNLPMDAISFGSAKVIKFVVYLWRRRTDPEASLDDIGKITLGAMEASVPDGALDDNEVAAASVGRPT